METTLKLDILPQPDETTCGPTCLHALYLYYGIKQDLPELINEIQRLKNGGTLGVLLANHALRRGLAATIYTYNLKVFDPTWFTMPGTDIRAKLVAQGKVKESKRLEVATTGYLEYLDRGGRLAFEELTDELIFGTLERGTPILTGLSATYLYRCPREFGPKSDFDDVRGLPQGHFVVLCGFDRGRRTVLVADPLSPNPPFDRHFYELDVDRVKHSILLGILTYDSVLVAIEPKEGGVLESEGAGLDAAARGRGGAAKGGGDGRARGRGRGGEGKG